MSDTMVLLMKISDDRNVSMGVFFLFILVCGVCVCVLVDVHLYMCAHVYGGQRLTKMSFTFLSEMVSSLRNLPLSASSA